MTTVELSGVALRTHDASYPLGVDPFAHQLEMRRLVRDRDRFVAVNDSPTGGGKTSSWLAPALEQRRDTIAVYPTNALITDQQEAIRRTVDNAIDHDVAVLTATSPRLSEVSDRFDGGSHGAILDDWIRLERRRNDQVILLTNPDIFVMLRRGLYRKPSRAYKDFELAVVDEFHRAGRKEQNTLRYLLDEMQSEDDAIVGLRQVAFLSATPDERQERLFRDAMEAPYHRVTRDDHEERQSFTDSTGNDWYEAMPPVELDVRTAPTFGTGGELIAHEDDTLSFCRGGRTVVMVDGVHEVGQVHTWLSNELDGQVERIDGFYSENKAKKLERFDVLVSNSAVEVGIDFDVDRILFAGHDRDSFLQRLGRLRSETDWRQARCYVPSGIGDVFSKFDGKQITRERLEGVLTDAYPEPRQPQTFDARYSAAEAFHYLETRLWNVPTENQDEIERTSLDRVRRHFNVGLDTEFSLRDMEAFADAIDWNVLTDLQWYRGDSLQALVYDRAAERLTTYGLFYLLRYGDVEFLERETFERLVPEDFSDDIERHERYVEGFCVYDGTIEMNDEGYGRDVYFTGGTLTEWLDGTADTGRKPQVKPGLSIGVDPNGTGSHIRTVTKINDRLRDRGQRFEDGDGGLLCYPVNGPSSRVKRQYDLGEFFFLYPIRVQNEDIHSLAIGTDALYLHCHVIERQAEFSQGEFIGGI